MTTNNMNSNDGIKFNDAIDVDVDYDNHASYTPLVSAPFEKVLLVLPRQR